MSKRKRVKIEIKGGIEGKICTKCDIWKPLTEYHNTKGNSVGKFCHCKQCVSEARKRHYFENKESVKAYNKEYYASNSEKVKSQVKKYRDSNIDKVRASSKSTYEKNREYYLEKAKQYALENKETVKEYQKSFYLNNRSKFKSYRLNRKARLKALGGELSSDKMNKIMEKFNYSCALSLKKESIHMDHVIPLITGHGGTAYGNMLPLHAELNLSKHDNNIFEWFKANRQRFNLSQEKFDEAIHWLANINGLSVEDYRDHVYWCHENPHSLEDLREDDESGAI